MGDQHSPPPIVSGLEIRLFGRPEFRQGDCVLPPPGTQKTTSLLAYLILHRDHPRSRDELATLLWGDRDDVRARQSLATALWRIRRWLADDYILVDVASLQFNPSSPFWLDVAEFEKVLDFRFRVSDLASPSEIRHLKSAVELYRGDLLEGFYDDWCIEERYRLQALYLDALAHLVARFTARRDLTSVLMYAEKYLAYDPLAENIHLAAMRAHATLNDWGRARHQWQRYCDARRRELHLSPSPEALKQAEVILGAQFFVPLPIGREQIISPRLRGDVESLPLVGRARELEALVSRWDQAVQGKGGLVLIDGEAGIGKTRLTEELAAVVRWRGGVVARGRACEAARVIPYCPFAEIVRALLNTYHNRHALPAWMRAELARLVPELDPSKGTVERDLRAVRLLHAIRTLVCDAASRAPVLMVLEDLHWADDSTLAGVDYLTRQISEVRVLLVGTFRPEEVDEKHALTSTAAQLARDGLAQDLSLAPLSAEAVAELVERVRGGDGELARQLYAHTEGNALFLAETLRELARTPRVTHLPIARSVRALIQARLARLSPCARELAACAAVAGRVFDLNVVCRAAKVDEETALDGIDELLLRGLLREGTDASGRDCEFVHALMREVAYESLHHRRRRRLHRLIGEALETLDPARRAELSGILAHHFDRAGVCGKGLEYAEQAARHAWNLGATNETVQYYDLALSSLESIGAAACGERAYRERRFDLLLGCEQALDVLARREEQAATQGQLAELAETLDDDARRAQVHLRCFWFNYPKQLADARREAERALALAREQHHKAFQVQASYALALVHARSEEPARGLEYAEAALEQARELQDRVLEGWSLLQLGFIYKRLNDWDRAQAILEQALAHNRALASLLAVGRTLIHLGDVCRARGDSEQANRRYREALTLAHETGYRWVEEDAVARLEGRSS